MSVVLVSVAENTITVAADSGVTTGTQLRAGFWERKPYRKLRATDSGLILAAAGVLRAPGDTRDVLDVAVEAAGRHTTPVVAAAAVAEALAGMRDELLRATVSEPDRFAAFTHPRFHAPALVALIVAGVWLGRPEAHRVVLWTQRNPSIAPVDSPGLALGPPGSQLDLDLRVNATSQMTAADAGTLLIETIQDHAARPGHMGLIGHGGQLAVITENDVTLRDVPSV